MNSFVLLFCREAYRSSSSRTLVLNAPCRVFSWRRHSISSHRPVFNRSSTISIPSYSFVVLSLPQLLPKHINIQLLNYSQHNTQRVHKPIHRNPQHTIRRGAVGRLQHGLTFFVRIVVRIRVRRFERKTSVHEWRELLVDLDGLQGC